MHEPAPLQVVASVPARPMGAYAARAFLHVWLDLALNAPDGRPVFCPGCRALVTAVAVGRGQPAWFRIEPCGCRFEIEPVT